MRQRHLDERRQRTDQAHRPHLHQERCRRRCGGGRVRRCRGAGSVRRPDAEVGGILTTTTSPTPEPRAEILSSAARLGRHLGGPVRGRSAQCRRSHPRRRTNPARDHRTGHGRHSRRPRLRSASPHHSRRTAPRRRRQNNRRRLTCRCDASTRCTNGDDRGRGRDRSPHGSQVHAERRGRPCCPACPAPADEPAASEPVGADNLIHATRPGGRYSLIVPPARVCLRTRYCPRMTGCGSGFSGAAASSERCGRC